MNQSARLWAPNLNLNGKRFAFAGLIQFAEPTDSVGLDAFERRALGFCQHWLTGKTHFAFKTSGSTGAPKTLILTRSQMLASACLTGRTLGLRAGDRALACLPIAHIAGAMMLVRGFALGLDLTVVTPKANPLAGLADPAFDFTALVPLQLQTLLNAGVETRAVLDKMRAILVGGAPLNGIKLTELNQLKAPVYHTYGMTETASHVALRRLNGPESSDYFVPLAGVTTGLDKRGCLTIQSAATRNQTLLTHDRVALNGDGSFRWLGRIDNVINSGGVKVQAEQVERALGKVLPHFQGGVLSNRRFFVGPEEHDRLGQAVVGIIEGPPMAAALAAELREQLLASGLLEQYEVPRCFYFYPRLVETITGKINRQATLQALGKSIN